MRVKLTPQQRLKEIGDIIECVVERCVVVGGSTSKTKDEITENEINQIYLLARGPERNSTKKQVKKKQRKAIKFSELKRLSVCNSSRMPTHIEVTGKVKGKTVTRFMEWTGIGWIEISSRDAKNPVLVTED